MPRQDRCSQRRGDCGRSDGLGSGRHDARRRRRGHSQGNGAVEEEARRLHALVVAIANIEGLPASNCEWSPFLFMNIWKMGTRTIIRSTMQNELHLVGGSF